MVYQRRPIVEKKETKKIIKISYCDILELSGNALKGKKFISFVLLLYPFVSQILTATLLACIAGLLFYFFIGINITQFSTLMEILAMALLYGGMNSILYGRARMTEDFFKTLFGNYKYEEIERSSFLWKIVIALIAVSLPALVLPL